MQTREIPRDEWREYLDTFSREHEGWQVTVEVFSREIGDQVLTEGTPLLGVRYSGERGDNESISVSTGEEASNYVSHTIPAPSHVRVAQTDRGEPQGLQIESQTEPTTLVTFHSHA